MAASRPQLHHSLPAPVVHAGFSISQSKSNVLAGVQDAYWSDDEAEKEDAECPLCLEEMDISDINFKPCICGYQICRFCWHHIKENLNKRCPACRRVYTDDAVEFKPIATQDHKRLTQQKKQRERERKELDTLGRRHLANVRVVQRNVVYVVGIGPRFAKEELIPTLRSNEYFGQYGKISKILLVKRTPSGGGAPVVGLYITYHRREDAARSISAVDGTPSPGGGRELMRASHGTTKYCMAFLRGVTCSDHSCMNLHEWGDEKDCFTKEDLTTLKHTIKTTESRSRNDTTINKKIDDQDSGGLPRAASWAQKPSSQGLSVGTTTSHHVSSTTASRQVRRGVAIRYPRNAAIVSPSSSDTRPANNIRAVTEERKPALGSKLPPQASSSRPSTPALSIAPQRTNTPTSTKAARQKKEPTLLPPSHSPAPSTPIDSEPGSGVQDILLSSPAPHSSPAESSQPSPAFMPSVPPGLPTPHMSVSRPPRLESTSPQTPLLASQSSYQMSIAARALLDDVKARRESILPTTTGHSPFPDFDRTLQTLSTGDGDGFSFNLDPRLAGDDADDTFPNFGANINTPFHGSFIDAFPALRSPLMAPPGIPYPLQSNRGLHNSPSITEKQASKNTSYLGSFNPFAESNEEDPPQRTPALESSQQFSLDDDSRKVSRFGFARGRQGSTTTSSPTYAPSSLGNSTSDSTSIYNSTDVPFQTVPQALTPWSPHGRRDYSQTSPNSLAGTLPSQQPHMQRPYSQRFQPFDSGVSEAQLRDFIHSSRERMSSSNGIQHNQAEPLKSPPSQAPFHDPAIMSAQFASPTSESLFNQVSYGPPPGLSYRQGLPTPSETEHAGNNSGLALGGNGSAHASSTASPVLSTPFSPSDFPTLIASSSLTCDGIPFPESGLSHGTKAREKAERAAAKKSAGVEKAAERQKLAHERAIAKAADRTKIRDKAAETSTQPEVLPAEREKVLVDKSKSIVTKPDSDRDIHRQKERAQEADKEKNSQARRPGIKNSNKRPDKPTIATETLQPASLPISEPKTQLPLLSKKPRKTRPPTKPIKLPKDDGPVYIEAPEITTVITPDVLTPPTNHTSSFPKSDRNTPAAIKGLLKDIGILNPGMDLPNHPFFDVHKINPATSLPLEYGPLVHALSALSVGGGSFANNIPSGSIDNAVSSFQQLLETLTQTISDLLRLLPRTTWDDSSSFDGVLRDMLKGDDFLDDGGEDVQGKEDEVAALTLALERRARWMEVQLSKLEELHRDINTAAVRAVLSFNDKGWDHQAFMPRIGNTLRRFDSIGVIEEGTVSRPLTTEELETKLLVAKEAAVFAETEVREIMERIQMTCIRE